MYKDKRVSECLTKMSQLVIASVKYKYFQFSAHVAITLISNALFKNREIHAHMSYMTFLKSMIYYTLELGILHRSSRSYFSLLFY